MKINTIIQYVEWKRSEDINEIELQWHVSAPEYLKKYNAKIFSHSNKKFLVGKGEDSITVDVVEHHSVRNAVWEVYETISRNVIEELNGKMSALDMLSEIHDERLGAVVKW